MKTSLKACNPTQDTAVKCFGRNNVAIVRLETHITAILNSSTNYLTKYNLLSNLSVKKWTDDVKDVQVLYCKLNQESRDMRIKMRESDSYIASVFFMFGGLVSLSSTRWNAKRWDRSISSIAVTLLYKICAQILKLKAKIPNLELSNSLHERQIFCTLVNNIFLLFWKTFFPVKITLWESMVLRWKELSSKNLPWKLYHWLVNHRRCRHNSKRYWKG